MSKTLFKEVRYTLGHLINGINNRQAGCREPQQL
jgi:hypothetical protein